ncbi:methionine ABC transporter permease [Vagococcus zengguangii]|uniref:ABC transporter permease subunit n=1 Tax=Vagococcus zengguangii TaxID=2571750 RepID=A0A4D7CU97_9ENTE|nr:ABC transporter permease subunit [Vagococcus zengguangii]QCI86794.1 ABC transporter permease subunit [Vagococcus zengguangii]TLG80400.1 ABC transporter permease subunit [Vagococcus zengguangii]
MKEIIEVFNTYRVELFTACAQTGLMLLVSMTVALLIGLPMGTLIFLGKTDQLKHPAMKFLSKLAIVYVDVVRSFPFLLLVVALIPFTRLVLGTSFGTGAASLPLSFVAVAQYGRMVEQSLLDVPVETIALAKSLGATLRQFIFNFLYVEARSSLVLSFTTVTIGMVSYSTIMGVVGGGGIGDFAIRYGYQSYEFILMYLTIVLMIVMVVLIQLLGSFVSKKIDKRR